MTLQALSTLPADVGGLVVIAAVAGFVLGLASERHPLLRRILLAAAAGGVTILLAGWVGPLLGRLP
jgi:VIT1/CCC1 family predicted Fe2+/Mn2+ transporter